MEKKHSSAVEILTATSLLASSITGCQNTDAIAQSKFEDIQKEPPVTETVTVNDERFTPPILESTLPNLHSPTEIPQSIPEQQQYIEQEIKQFNYEILNIGDWSQYEIEKVEAKEPGYGIEILDQTSMYMIPLRKDNFVDERREMKEILVPPGHSFEIAEVRSITGPNGEKIRLGLIANTYGANFVSAVLLGATDENGTKVEFTRDKESTSRVVSYIVTEDSIYPNKVINTLIALRNMSEFQDVNGPFKSGLEYSYIDMIGLKAPNKKNEYEYGLTSSKSRVKGGGVCAMATGISTLVHIQNGTSYEVIEQWVHPVRYAQGPFSPSEYLVDATVDYNENTTYDLRWIQGEDKYLHIKTFAIPSDLPYSKTERDGVGGLSDVFLVVSLSFENTPPPQGQTAILQKELENYRDFRSSQHQQNLNPNQMNVNVLGHQLDAKMQQSVDLIYNVEDLRLFSSRIEQSTTFKNLLELQESVNNYSEGNGQSIYEYLRQSDWYNGFVTDENKGQIDRILMLSTTARVPGQPLQCVGFVMMTSLLYPDLQIPYVGGSGVASARELIPDEIIKNKYTEIRTFYTNYGTLLLVGQNIGIDNYNPGDLFVRVDGAPMASTGKPTGHVGLILDKVKDERGNTVLLVADSNRHNDGRIKIFVVKEGDMDEVFGHGQRYILRYINRTR